MSSSFVNAKNLINETTSVPILSFKSYYLNVETDQLTIKLSINVYMGDITVGVLDETNYNIWVDGNDAQAYLVRNNIMSGDFEVELGSAGIYYIVLDNSDSLLLPAQLRITVSVSTIGETVGIVIGSALGLALLIFIITRTARDRRIQPVQQYQTPIVQTPDTVVYADQQTQKTVKYCKECGSRLDLDSSFCPNCGTEQ